jgi:hypothetical protein
MHSTFGGASHTFFPFEIVALGQSAVFPTNPTMLPHVGLVVGDGTERGRPTVPTGAVVSVTSSTSSYSAGPVATPGAILELTLPSLTVTVIQGTALGFVVADGTKTVTVTVPVDGDAVIVSLLGVDSVVVRYGTTHTASLTLSAESFATVGHPTVSLTGALSPNPTRGFYSTGTPGNDDVMLAGFERWSVNELLNTRLSGDTLVFKNYLLDKGVTTLSVETLLRIRTDFIAVRHSGMRMIVRWCYTKVLSANGDPHGDAPLATIQSHLNGLAPVLAEFADVVAVFQAGFVGTWGNWALSDHVTSASERGVALRAIMAAAPGMPVAVRIPALAGTLTSPTADELSRLAHHNDCLLGSSSDFGTYASFDSETTMMY